MRTFSNISKLKCLIKGNNKLIGIKVALINKVTQIVEEDVQKLKK